jgi:hypothetical protein
MEQLLREFKPASSFVPMAKSCLGGEGNTPNATRFDFSRVVGGTLRIIKIFPAGMETHTRGGALDLKSAISLNAIPEVQEEQRLAQTKAYFLWRDEEEQRLGNLFGLAHQSFVRVDRTPISELVAGIESWSETRKEQQLLVLEQKEAHARASEKVTLLRRRSGETYASIADDTTLTNAERSAARARVPGENVTRLHERGETYASIAADATLTNAERRKARSREKARVTAANVALLRRRSGETYESLAADATLPDAEHKEARSCIPAEIVTLLRRRNWSAKEDASLLKLWSSGMLVNKKSIPSRSMKACQSRWHSHVRPGLRLKDEYPFTTEENVAILAARSSTPQVGWSLMEKGTRCLNDRSLLQLRKQHRKLSNAKRKAEEAAKMGKLKKKQKKSKDFSQQRSKD